MDGSAKGEAVRSLLEMCGISKSFGAIRVLSDISFDVRAGEVHALCGENGAGKSTLMKILGGSFPPSAGGIFWDGRGVSFSHPAEARAVGIGIIHQELSLLPHRTVAENIVLGREPQRGGRVDRRRMLAQAKAVLNRLGSAIAPETVVADLSIAERQVVEIAKALLVDARLLVFDEPTAALDTQESDRLFEVIRELRRSGVGIVYISHRMREIFAIADRVTVLKDGQAMGTLAAAEANPDTIIRLMVGRSVNALFPSRTETAPALGEPLLSLSAAGNAALHDLTFTLHAGEIVGFAGLEGCGKSEVARAIFGDMPFLEGETRLFDGRPAPRSPREAAARGIAYLSDDRKSEGLGLRQAIRDNTSLVLRALAPMLARPSRGRSRARAVDELLRKVELRAADFGVPVGKLSGGNQQKVIVARWLATHARIWVIVEPTRGIDVGAKASIYTLLRRHADAGGAVLMVSSDLTEIIGLSDRILVMSSGRIAAELPPGASEELIMTYAVHGHGSSAELAA